MKDAQFTKRDVGQQEPMPVLLKGHIWGVERRSPKCRVKGGEMEIRLGKGQGLITKLWSGAFESAGVRPLAITVVESVA